MLVLIEGWAAAGKGSLIREMIREIDPRFYSVVSSAVTPENAFLPIVGALPLKCSVLKAEQPLNAPEPMLVTAAGMVTLSRPVLRKA